MGSKDSYLSFVQRLSFVQSVHYERFISFIVESFFAEVRPCGYRCSLHIHTEALES